MRALLGVAAVLLVAAGCVLARARCSSRFTRAVPVDLRSVGPGARPSDPETLSLVVHPSVIPVTTMEEYEVLADYLKRQTGRPFRVVQRRTYAEVNELLRSGMVTVAIVCTGAWLEMRQNQVPISQGAMPVIAGATSYKSLILVRNTSPIRSIEDLEGCSFAFTDPLSLSGYLYPHWLLIERGHDPGTFLGRTSLSYSHQASLRAVASGSVDAASVDSLVLDRLSAQDPALRSSVRVVHSSPELPFAPVVVPESVDPDLRDRICRALLAMHESEEGRSVLARIHVDRFVEPRASAYDLVLEIHGRVNRFLRR